MWQWQQETKNGGGRAAVGGGAGYSRKGRLETEIGGSVGPVPIRFNPLFFFCLFV